MEFHDLILFWSSTGLRPGELIALKWIDLDELNGVLSVRRSRSNITQKDGPPKTQSSERDIALRSFVLNVLNAQKARIGNSSSYIWPFKGKQHSHKTLNRRFKCFLKMAGLKHRPPVHMRHTFATLHIGAGESISWVSKVMGHTSVKITLENYNRYIPNLTRDDGSAFESVLRKKN